MIGPRYNLVENNKKKKIFSKVKNIILTFGGEDPRNGSLFFLRSLKEILQQYHITVVVGPINKHKKNIKNFLLTNKFSYKLIVNPDNIVNYKTQDIFILRCKFSLFKRLFSHYDKKK